MDAPSVSRDQSNAPASQWEVAIVPEHTAFSVIVETNMPTMRQSPSPRAIATTAIRTTSPQY